MFNLLSVEYESTSRVMSAPETWFQFLATAAWHYKYNFREQRLIWITNQDAKACATAEEWHKIGRGVLPDATSIPLLNQSGDVLLTKSVYDIAQTISIEDKPFTLWKHDPAFADSAIEALEAAFGNTWTPGSLIEAVCYVIDQQVEENYYSDYTLDLRTCLSRSVEHMVSIRLGVESRFTESDFVAVTELKTYDDINAFGNIVSDLVRSILKEITIAEREAKKERLKEEDQDHGESNNSGNSVRPGGRDLHAGNQDTAVRQGGRFVSDRGRSSRSDNEANDIRDVWTPEKRLPAGGEAESVQRAATPGTAVPATVRDGRAVLRTGEAGRAEDDEGRGDHGVDEVVGLVDIRAGSGAYPPDRTAGSAGGDRLHLIPNGLIQEDSKKAEEDKTSAFSISQQDIDAVIFGGSHYENSKYRIYFFFEGHPKLADSVAFLKHEYGIGGGSRIFTDGAHGWENHDSKGISIVKGSLLDDEAPKVTLPWSKVDARIRMQILRKQYLSEKEMEMLPEKRLELAKRDADTSKPIVAVENKELPLPKAGDTLYIGTDKYILLSYSPVVLQDYNFPLLTRTLLADDFSKMYRENPLNADDPIVIKPRRGRPDYRPQYGAVIPVLTPMEELVVSSRHDEETLSAVDTELLANMAKSDLDDTRAAVESEERREDKLLPPAPKAASHVTVIRPDATDRLEYRIHSDDLATGGPKAKYAANTHAIRTLKQIEKENRLASADEQEILSKYVGWGGLASAFDEHDDSWTKEYHELKDLLTDEEYSSARESTLNAHYTSPVIIREMFRAIEGLGFRTGNVLEPSCGIGNFYGCVPDSMHNSKFYGVELDSLTGRIGQQLYQKANIAIQGFEKSSLPDSFFDLAIGNIPFGSYKIADPRYDKYGFMVHDYFFAKSIDKVRPGGVIAFVTSKGTMDKQSPAVRKYIAEKCELLGAIRLPNDAFKANAGTSVTSDILFLQKRDRPMVSTPSWIFLGETEDGIPVNQYFIDHSKMVLGTLSRESSRFGEEVVCLPKEGSNLSDLLRDAVKNISGTMIDREEDLETPDVSSIPADPDVRNHSFCLVQGDIYYREDSLMTKEDLPKSTEARIKSLISVRDCLRELITAQVEDRDEEEITDLRADLNRLYDAFSQKYGLINDTANQRAIRKDASSPLLLSLEELDENGELKNKSDIFTKRTIRMHRAPDHVDTASEALFVSISEKAAVDLAYMESLTGKTPELLEQELTGIIFRDFGEDVHSFFDVESLPLVTADEYLSGNVRKKLKTVQLLKAKHPDLAETLAPNIRSLEAVQPQDLSPSEISVRLGATWIPADDVRDFIIDLLEPNRWAKDRIEVLYSNLSSDWTIAGKSMDSGNILARTSFGTVRVNAYKIIEDTLNLRDVRVFDTHTDEEGRKISVLNRKETLIAQQKQDLIKSSFTEWIWKDPSRRERLSKMYNEKFNSIRTRRYDGGHISFGGMNPGISLRKHQVDAVARILYGGNSLLGHVVGAGKTFEIVAAAMESKRLGLAQKSLIVVPNHLIAQWAAEFLQLYPTANILAATKKDFEPANRKKFCSRIATGDFDAVIIGHSQFEKIPMSPERQIALLQDQLNEAIEAIAEAKAQKQERFTIKELERSKKSIQVKLEKLNDMTRKDDIIMFEELGVDRLFVDEAHNYKNLFLFTKMRNVGGIAQTEAQKSSDLFMKCRYMDEKTNGRGVVFATGTPISNSMVELYTMQRYLQMNKLKELNLQHFDAWASTFGETVTSIELAPEGTGYRAKTRFAKFYNLPELMTLFQDVADIQTADMLNLDVPDVTYNTEVIKPSEYQVQMVKELSERADRVRQRMVRPDEDNMLKITNDGRKLALDQRLAAELLPDHEDGKVSRCAKNVFRIWRDGADNNLTQLVFCDLSTPHFDGAFNVYDDLKEKLVAMGVPSEEVAFIHSADTDLKKAELFSKVRSGTVRVLMGSTAKMGAGTNVQTRLVASHHLDCPWRPADLEQRDGRIIRQKNTNKQVEIFRYVTEGTFDAYLYQLVENKQRFIGQIMTSKSPARSAEDIDESALSYAEVKALATGNPHIKEKMDLDIEVAKLKVLKASHLSTRYQLEDSILTRYPQMIRRLEESIASYEKDLATASLTAQKLEKGLHPMVIYKQTYTSREEAGAALIRACKSMQDPSAKTIGSYRGFSMTLLFDTFSKDYKLTLQGECQHTIYLGSDVYGNLTRIDNGLENMQSRLASVKHELEDARKQFENAKIEVLKPFAQAEVLESKSARLAELNSLLNMDERVDTVMDDQEQEEQHQEQGNDEQER